MVRPFIVVGPTFGLILSAKDSSGADLKSDLKSLDLGFAVGGGVDFTNMIGVEVRFGQSLSDILSDAGRTNFGLASDSSIKVKNRAITILVDVKLR